MFNVLCCHIEKQLSRPKRVVSDPTTCFKSSTVFCIVPNSIFNFQIFKHTKENKRNERKISLSISGEVTDFLYNIPDNSANSATLAAMRVRCLVLSSRGIGLLERFPSGHIVFLWTIQRWLQKFIFRLMRKINIQNHSQYMLNFFHLDNCFSCLCYAFVCRLTHPRCTC